MAIENRFNLIDEPWIPIADVGRVSLRQVFSEPSYRSLGGNPVQKIALMKLLLAIAQSAATPKDDDEWREFGAEGVAKKCVEYLEKWYDRFWLYGEKPFLQMPAVENLIKQREIDLIKAAKNESAKRDAAKKSMPKSCGVGFYPDLPTENNTVLSHTLVGNNLSDAERALFVLMLMNFSFGGKTVESGLINLAGRVYGNKYSAKSGPSLGNYVGYLHSFLFANSLINSVWVNIFTNECLQQNRVLLSGVGVAPWEEMPTTEECDVALSLKDSYMSRLVAVSKFVLLKESGIYYLDGINYPSHKEGWREPSVTYNEKGKEVKVIWLNPDKKPWRELVALLSFLDSTNQGDFYCQQIANLYYRAISNLNEIGVWSGGLKVRANSGDQSVKQDDDFVESCVILPAGESGNWFGKLKNEMKELDELWGGVKFKVRLYLIELKKQEEKKPDNEIIGMAVSDFWQMCEREFQNLIEACDSDNHKEICKSMRKKFASFAQKTYDTYCPKDTARQLDAWAKNKPNFSKYLSAE